MSRPVAAASPSDIQAFDRAPAADADAAARAWMPRRLLGGLAALSAAGIASAFPGGGLVPPAASAAAALGGMLAFVLVLAAATAHRRFGER
jgi:hypothetical protein